MRMLLDFAVLSMLMKPVFGAQPPVELAVSIIGSWCLSEESGHQKLGTDIYNRVAKANDYEGIHIRQTSYDVGFEDSCTIKRTERLSSTRT